MEKPNRAKKRERGKERERETHKLVEETNKKLCFCPYSFLTTQHPIRHINVSFSFEFSQSNWYLVYTPVFSFVNGVHDRAVTRNQFLMKIPGLSENELVSLEKERDREEEEETVSLIL